MRWGSRNIRILQNLHKRAEELTLREICSLTGPMDKKALLQLFTEKVAGDLHVMTQAAIAAHEGATHAESKAEDQYDTRGLESSYLAGAQSKRALELEATLGLFRFIDLRVFTLATPIAATAVIELASDGKHARYFFMPKGGGMSVTFQGHSVLIVTPQSPLGEAILGRKVGDAIEVGVGATSRDYEIIAVW